MKKRMLSLAVLAASLFCFSDGANAQKTEKLFNGKDLSNWNFVVDKNSVPADQVYSVRDGKIFITGQPFGYMYTKEKYSDYKLHVEWRWAEWGFQREQRHLPAYRRPKEPLPERDRV